MSTQREIYEAAGFGAAVPRGRRPAILVVDFSYGFTDTQYPTASDMAVEIAATRQLTDFSRQHSIPIVYTTIAFQPWERNKLAWLKKATGMAALMAGSRLVEIDGRTGKLDRDPLIVKHGASAFHGTNLASLLSAAGVDTVVVTGATTSGCVRATVVDAVQSGFHVLVAEDCCADRATGPHEASIYDMQQKYADVTDSSDILTWLENVVLKQGERK